ncbi:unnamed protein product [Amoebophrya sp. A25]|nr:unnamed protein product [Amoebophrya sp. A25]|eukprot:GSA25T00012698001.1
MEDLQFVYTQSAPPAHLPGAGSPLAGCFSYISPSDAAVDGAASNPPNEHPLRPTAKPESPPSFGEEAGRNVGTRFIRPRGTGDTSEDPFPTTKDSPLFGSEDDLYAYLSDDMPYFSSNYQTDIDEAGTTAVTKMVDVGDVAHPPEARLLQEDQAPRVVLETGDHGVVTNILHQQDESCNAVTRRGRQGEEDQAPRVVTAPAPGAPDFSPGVQSVATVPLHGSPDNVEQTSLLMHVGGETPQSRKNTKIGDHDTNDTTSHDFSAAKNEHERATSHDLSAAKKNDGGHTPRCSSASRSLSRSKSCSEHAFLGGTRESKESSSCVVTKGLLPLQLSSRKVKPSKEKQLHEDENDFRASLSEQQGSTEDSPISSATDRRNRDNLPQNLGNDLGRRDHHMRVRDEAKTSSTKPRTSFESQRPVAESPLLATAEYNRQLAENLRKMVSVRSAPTLRPEFPASSPVFGDGSAESKDVHRVPSTTSLLLPAPVPVEDKTVKIGQRDDQAQEMPIETSFSHVIEYDEAFDVDTSNILFEDVTQGKLIVEAKGHQQNGVIKSTYIKDATDEMRRSHATHAPVSATSKVSQSPASEEHQYHLQETTTSSAGITADLTTTTEIHPASGSAPTATSGPPPTSDVAKSERLSRAPMPTSDGAKSEHLSRTPMPTSDGAKSEHFLSGEDAEILSLALELGYDEATVLENLGSLDRLAKLECRQNLQRLKIELQLHSYGSDCTPRSDGGSSEAARFEQTSITPRSDAEDAGGVGGDARVHGTSKEYKQDLNQENVTNMLSYVFGDQSHYQHVAATATATTREVDTKEMITAASAGMIDADAQGLENGSRGGSTTAGTSSTSCPANMQLIPSTAGGGGGAGRVIGTSVTTFRPYIAVVPEPRYTLSPIAEESVNDESTTRGRSASEDSTTRNISHVLLQGTAGSCTAGTTTSTAGVSTSTAVGACGSAASGSGASASSSFAVGASRASSGVSARGAAALGVATTGAALDGLSAPSIDEVYISPLVSRQRITSRKSEQEVNRDAKTAESGRKNKDEVGTGKKIDEVVFEEAHPQEAHLRRRETDTTDTAIDIDNKQQNKNTFSPNHQRNVKVDARGQASAQAVTSSSAVKSSSPGGRAFLQCRRDGASVEEGSLSVRLPGPRPIVDNDAESDATTSVSTALERVPAAVGHDHGQPPETAEVRQHLDRHPRASETLLPLAPKFELRTPLPEKDLRPTLCSSPETIAGDEVFPRKGEVEEEEAPDHTVFPSATGSREEEGRGGNGPQHILGEDRQVDQEQKKIFLFESEGAANARPACLLSSPNVVEMDEQRRLAMLEESRLHREGRKLADVRFVLGEKERELRTREQENADCMGRFRRDLRRVSDENKQLSQTVAELMEQLQSVQEENAHLMADQRRLHSVNTTLAAGNQALVEAKEVVYESGDDAMVVRSSKGVHLENQEEDFHAQLDDFAALENEEDSFTEAPPEERLRVVHRDGRGQNDESRGPLREANKQHNKKHSEEHTSNSNSSRTKKPPSSSTRTTAVKRRRRPKPTGASPVDARSSSAADEAFWSASGEQIDYKAHVEGRDRSRQGRDTSCQDEVPKDGRRIGEDNRDDALLQSDYTGRQVGYIRGPAKVEAEIISRSSSSASVGPPRAVPVVELQPSPEPLLVDHVSYRLDARPDTKDTTFRVQDHVLKTDPPSCSVNVYKSSSSSGTTNVQGPQGGARDSTTNSNVDHDVQQGVTTSGQSGVRGLKASPLRISFVDLHQIERSAEETKPALLGGESRDQRDATTSKSSKRLSSSSSSSGPFSSAHAVQQQPPELSLAALSPVEGGGASEVVSSNTHAQEVEVDHQRNDARNTHQPKNMTYSRRTSTSSSSATGVLINVPWKSRLETPDRLFASTVSSTMQNLNSVTRMIPPSPEGVSQVLPTKEPTHHETNSVGSHNVVSVVPTHHELNTVGAHSMAVLASGAGHQVALAKEASVATLEPSSSTPPRRKIVRSSEDTRSTDSRNIILGAEQFRSSTSTIRQLPFVQSLAQSHVESTASCSPAAAIHFEDFAPRQRSGSFSEVFSVRSQEQQNTRAAASKPPHCFYTGEAAASRQYPPASSAFSSAAPSLMVDTPFTNGSPCVFPPSGVSGMQIGAETSPQAAAYAGAMQALQTLISNKDLLEELTTKSKNGSSKASVEQRVVPKESKASTLTSSSAVHLELSTAAEEQGQATTAIERVQQTTAIVDHAAPPAPLISIAAHAAELMQAEDNSARSSASSSSSRSGRFRQRIPATSTVNHVRTSSSRSRGSKRGEASAASSRSCEGKKGTSATGASFISSASGTRWAWPAREVLDGRAVAVEGAGTVEDAKPQKSPALGPEGVEATFLADETILGINDDSRTFVIEHQQNIDGGPVVAQQHRPLQKDQDGQYPQGGRGRTTTSRIDSTSSPRRGGENESNAREKGSSSSSSPIHGSCSSELEKEHQRTRHATDSQSSSPRKEQQTKRPQIHDADAAQQKSLSDESNRLRILEDEMRRLKDEAERVRMEAEHERRLREQREAELKRSERIRTKMRRENFELKGVSGSNSARTKMTSNVVNLGSATSAASSSSSSKIPLVGVVPRRRTLGDATSIKYLQASSTSVASSTIALGTPSTCPIGETPSSEPAAVEQLVVDGATPTSPTEKFIEYSSPVRKRERRRYKESGPPKGYEKSIAQLQKAAMHAKKLREQREYVLGRGGPA